ncbi:peptidoglycan DD-metalloendopeptidase family protein [Burkholderia contaminans]|uniref:peptidoglycan DD-metalloendopeptidase family protein n=1 Tax=Burkholderia contaminans TaxID=488447 RepID=UPI00084BDCFF|nr:peptidoglycan DD-metalloendopeptidase family protein [Burkholderia contaminans]ODN26474.1 peptidase [Burkholderia contaminans]
MSMLRAMQNNRSREPLTLAQRAICVAAFSTLLAACATRLDNAPVVDRSGSLGTTGAAQPAAPLPPAPPGYYRVKPGDTLYRIALENGQNYRDIAAWNNLANPNQIEGTSSSVATPPAAAAASSDTAAAPSGPVTFAWPARGPVLNGFDDAKNKGVNIGGAAGETVKAAADGRVVYSGNGLRGYGNLIIIKHDATYLTAYAHNRALMVKEGDAVTKGQKIAEMGNSDSDRVMLHFEVRRQGKPVDPLKYLPPQ